MKKYLTILSLCLLSFGLKAQTTYHVATDGSGNFTTIAQVNAGTFSAGDQILFKRGDTFYGSLTVSQSGTSGNPITYGAYGTGAKPIITGFTTVSGWTSLGGNIWESTSAVSSLDSCNMVQVGGLNTPMGRYPNTGYLKYQSYSGHTTITSNSLTGTPNWTGASVVIKKLRYVISVGTITGQSGSTLTYGDDGIYNPTNNFGLFIQNDIRTLDVSNEWYYNRSTKKIDVYSISTPISVKVASLTNIVSISGNYITLDSLDIQGANGDAITLSGSHATIKNCNISFAGINGIRAPVSYITITGNNISYCNNMAISGTGSTSNGTFTNNTIVGIGVIAGATQTESGGSINTLGANTIVQYNSIDSSGFEGIYIQGAGTHADNNFINHSCLIKDDGGGIYTAFNDGGAKYIQNNIILNTIGCIDGVDNSDYAGYGIYLDSYTANCIVKGNTVANGNATGIFLSNLNGNTIRDNTVYNNSLNNGFGAQSQVMFEHICCNVTASNTFNNNILFTKATNKNSMFMFSNNAGSDDIPTFGSADSNYYVTPSVGLQFNTQYITTITARTFANWKTYMGWDTHSQALLKSSGAIDSSLFLYNATNTSVAQSLSYKYSDVKGTQYNSGLIILAPYTSVILLNTGTLTSAPIISVSGNQAITTTSTTIFASATWAAGHSGTYKWTQTAGTTATIASSTSASTGVSALAYGNSTFKCVITQDDGQKDSGYVSVFVKTPATLSYTSDTVQTYNGSPRSVTVITSPSGISGVSTTYAGLATPPTNAGIYPLVSSLTNSTYYASNITGILTINKASATITVSNTTQTYTGNPLAVTASISPAISGLSITYNGSSTAPTNAGTYIVIAKLTNSNYQATPDTVTFTINKATPTVSWATPSAITYGTALSGTQLNATASVAGSFTYTPASGYVPNAGTQLLSVNFTPTDATNYNSVNNTTVSLVVNKATATITLSNLNQSYDGTPKPVTVTTSPVGLTVITTTYNGSTTVPSAPGSYPVNASLNNSNYTATPATGTLVISSNAATIYITNYSNLIYNGNQQTPTVTCAYSYAVTYNGSGTPPTNVGSYIVIATINDSIHTGADTVTMSIIKATPVINWSNPTAITYGTALSGTQLNASSIVAGTFAYTPVSGTILNAGTYVLSTSFTPTDASNYNSATATVNLTVNQATATITASNFSQVYDGTPKPITASVSPSVSGLIVTYNGSTTPPTNAGSYAVNVSLSNPNYTATTVTGTLVISKVTPILSWTKPTQITEGTPLSSTQLNATSNVPGSFSYSYTVGTVLIPGTYGMTATFTPTDIVNYNGGSVSSTITVVGSPINNYYIGNGKIILVPKK